METMKNIMIPTTMTDGNYRLYVTGVYDSHGAAKKSENAGACVLSDGIFGHYARVEFLEDEEDSDYGIPSLNRALKLAFRNSKGHAGYMSHEDMELIDLKNFLQSGVCLAGWTFVEAMKDHSVFTYSFYLSCLHASGGRDEEIQIPNAELVFETYKKVCSRHGYECRA